MQHKYEALCRGEYNKKTIRESLNDSRYKCGYVNEKPLLVIQPIKYEIISIDPEISLYYEMVTERETRILKRLAFPHVRMPSFFS